MGEHRVSELVVTPVKISRYAVLRVLQVAENRPLARPQLFGFQSRPEVLGLRVVEALVAATLRAQAAVLVKQGAVGVGAVLACPGRNAPLAPARTDGPVAPYVRR